MRLLSSIICDDIRTEANGKDILIGCYNNVIVLEKAPAKLPTLFFRLLFDQQPRGLVENTFSLYDPSGKMLFRSTSQIVVEHADDPFVVKIGGGPFELEKFGTYELRMLSGKSESVVSSFMVRRPDTVSEKMRVGRRAQYFVVLDKGEWKIKHSDKHYGPYNSQIAAIKAAIETAHKSGQAGYDSQVVVQGKDHLFKTEWTYGHDPFPPQG